MNAYKGTVANFNPRSPRGERLSVFAVKVAREEISIHAPREGSDGYSDRNAE